jgi:hypothetical protein
MVTTALESSWSNVGETCSKPKSFKMLRKYTISLPASFAAYYSASAVLNDTLFCFVDFHDMQ